MALKKHFDNLEEYLCVFLMAFMSCVAFANVVSRYFFHFSISFSQELVLVAFVWATFAGVSIGFKRNSHVMVSFLVERFPRGLQKLLAFLSMLLSVVLFSALIYSSIDQILSEIDLGTSSDSLGIPVYWYTLGVPLISLLIVFRAWKAYRTLRKD